jgi:hypothetical protein
MSGSHDLVCREALTSLKNLTTFVEAKFNAIATLKFKFEKLEPDLGFVEKNTVSNDLVHYLSWHISCLLYFESETRLLKGDNTSLPDADVQNVPEHKIRSTKLCRLLVEHKNDLGSEFDEIFDEIRIEDHKILKLEDRIHSLVRFVEGKLLNHHMWKLCNKNESASCAVIKSDIAMGIDHTVMVLETGVYSEDNVKLLSKHALESQLKQGTIPDPDNRPKGFTKEILLSMLKGQEKEAQKTYECDMRDASSKRKSALRNIFYKAQDIQMTYELPDDQSDKPPLKRSFTMRRSIASALSRAQDGGAAVQDGSPAVKVVREEESQEWQHDAEYVSRIHADYKDRCSTSHQKSARDKVTEYLVSGTWNVASIGNDNEEAEFSE